MKKFFINFSLASSALFIASCMSVDSDVAPTPSRYWKAPKDALPENYVNPKQIKTDEIVSQDKVEKASDKVIAGKTLTLADLVDLALENNTVTRQYWFQAKVFAAQKGKVDATYMPTVTVGSKVYREKIRQISTFNLGVGTYWNTGYGASLEMNWLLYDFGKREALSDSARESLRAANFDYNQSLQDVVLNVYVSYFQLYNAMGSVKTAKANLEDAQNAYKAADARLQNNVGNKQDMLRALANAKNAEFALEQSNADVETKRAALANVLGIQVSQSLMISEEFVLPSSPEAQKQIDELMAGALKERQSILAAYSNLNAAERAKKASERDFLPKVSAVGSMQWGDYTNDRYFGTPSNNYSLGAVVSWEIFDGFTKQYELISAQAKERVAAQELKAQEISIMSDVWTYFYGYKSAIKQLDSTVSAVKASEEAYNATKIAYDNGVSTLTDLLNSQALLAQARLQNVTAEAYLAISVAQLAHATGALTASIPAE